MKHLFWGLAAILLILTSGCSTSYDDSAVWDEITSINKRLEQLEEQCNQMNTNILALHNIVSALQENDSITGIAPIVIDNKTIGYTISLAKGGTITILNGEDGKDGHTPAIGIKEGSDGIYYWTIDGEWMHDENGNKIAANTTNDSATDGITPKLKIEDDWWWVSYDNGATWERLGQAYCDQEYNSIFSSITEDDTNIYFHLTDGTTITIPRYVALAIEFDMAGIESFQPDTQYDIRYCVKGTNERVEIEVMTSADIVAKVVTEDYTQLQGSIHIETGSSITEYSKVIILVGCGQSVIMKGISLEDGQLQIVNGKTKHVSRSGGLIDLKFTTNRECKVLIPDTATSWISIAEPTRAAYTKSITLRIAENKASTRSATIGVESIDGRDRIEYTIIQESANINEPLANELWYTTSDARIITPYNTEAFGTNITSNIYDAKHGVMQFDDVLTKIAEQAFMNESRLKTVTLPQGVLTIGDSAFRRCTALTEITLSSTIKSIGANAFLRCEALSSITLPEALATIDDNAFAYCTSLVELTIPANLHTIGYGAFANCKSLKKIVVRSTTPPDAAANIFQNISSDAIIYVPSQSVDAYKTANGWSTYAQMIVGEEF